MEMLGYAALVLLGLLMGTVGVGGSMLAIPILVYVFSVNVPTASAYALFITGTTSLVAFALKYKDDMADIRAAMIFGIPSLALSFLTRALIVDRLPYKIRIGSYFTANKDQMLLLLLCVLMFASAFSMIRGRRESPSPALDRKAPVLAGLGIITGFFAGLVGIGGGFLILPALVVYGRLSFQVAIATTLIIISANSLIGFCGDMITQPIHWPFLLLATSLSFGGMFAGYRLQNRIATYVDQRSFGWIMGSVAILIAMVELFG